MSSTTYNIVPGRYEKQLPVTTKAHFKSSANSTNATSVKASAGTVFNMIIHNTHGGGGGGSSITVRFYDKATAPTVGTDVPMIIIHVGSSTSKEVNFTSGITFTNGIAYALTAGDSLLDATAVDADGVQVYMGYM
jgi:predicted transcriptional regulator